ncbi:MAG: hypothetical protein WA771_09105, partial [Chthoniobacterales bacterium]
MPPTEESLTDRIVARISGNASEDFSQLLLEVHAFQLAANPAYDRYCDAFFPATDWKSIPALPQHVFKQTAVRSFAPSETTATFRTSGTTGEGYGQHHFKTLELYRLAARRGWAEAGFDGAGTVISLVPRAADAPLSSLSQMAEWVATEFLTPDWSDVGTILALRSDPLILFGTALTFLDWFELLGDRTVALPPGSLAVETGGYKGSRRTIDKADLYAKFTAHLGLPPESVVN